MKTDVEAINDSLAYLADEHNLYLWRINESQGTGEDRKHVKGWSFTQRGYSNATMEGSTVTEAIRTRLAKILDNAADAKRKLNQQTTKHVETQKVAGKLLNNLEEV